jgi:glycosyltransferase involved in cell wall biosynthesis
MSDTNLRIIGAVYGDIHASPGARVKYGFLFEALARRYNLVGVYDASLYGLSRYLNALRVFHPNQWLWRARFYKNIPAFQARSQRLNARLRRMEGQADLALQVGVLFDAFWRPLPMPGVIYTDHTASLSAKNPSFTHSAFTPHQRRQWAELERGAFEHAAHICTRGELVRGSVIDDYGIPAEKVTAVGGGLNFPELPKLIEPRIDHPPTVLFIGKELHRKGGDLLLLAFEEARAHIPEARLLLLTAGSVLPASLPLEGVTLLPPTWDRAAIAALYRQADLFVLPSRLETWGDVLLEAMAYGLPCIGVAGQSMQEIIQDGVTGLVVPPNDAGALASALARLLADPALARRMGQAGRRRLEHNYTWDRVVERMAPALEFAY